MFCCYLWLHLSACARTLSVVARIFVFVFDVGLFDIRGLTVLITAIYVTSVALLLKISELSTWAQINCRVPEGCFLSLNQRMVEAR